MSEMNRIAPQDLPAFLRKYRLPGGAFFTSTIDRLLLRKLETRRREPSGVNATPNGRVCADGLFEPTSTRATSASFAPAADFSTSSIDTATEALIEDALHVMMAGRTVVAIAHRLSTIQDVDQILVLHKGELREQGSHRDLVALRGLYYRLYELQYRERVAG